MEAGLALLTRDTRPILAALAQLAGRLVPLHWYCAEPLCFFEALGMAESYLWCPCCTEDMHPVVPVCPLQGLAGHKRSVEFLLTVFVISFGLLRQFLFHPLLLALPVGLLLMRDFRWL